METETEKKVPQSLMTPRMTFLDSLMIFLGGVVVGALMTTFIVICFEAMRHHAG